MTDGRTNKPASIYRHKFDAVQSVEKAMFQGYPTHDGEWVTPHNQDQVALPWRIAQDSTSKISFAWGQPGSMTGPDSRIVRGG
jgi:hypothetical protein